MKDVILSTSELIKRFGGLTATDSLDFDVLRGELHTVIGPNGAGKTTLMKQLIGEEIPDSGSIVFDGVDISKIPSHRRALLGLSRSYQITSIFPEFTALDNVAIAAQAHDGHSFRFWRPADQDRMLNERSQQALVEVGLATRSSTLAAALAHGERRQLELAMAMVSQPKMLLLDEPMAGMGAGESEAMIELLKKIKSRYTIVLVEHDMNAVFTLADRITVLVYGRKIACGSPAEIRANEDVKKAYLGDRHAAH